MDPRHQLAWAVGAARRLSSILQQSSHVSSQALTRREGASPDVISSLAVAETIANQVTQTALAGLAAIGLSPNVPNGLTDDEIIAAFCGAVRQSRLKERLDCLRGGPLPTEEAKDRAAVALLTQADELAGLSRQMLFRATFYLTRAETLRDAEEEE